MTWDVCCWERNNKVNGMKDEEDKRGAGGKRGIDKGRMKEGRKEKWKWLRVQGGKVKTSKGKGRRDMGRLR